MKGETPDSSTEKLTVSILTITPIPRVTSNVTDVV